MITTEDITRRWRNAPTLEQGGQTPSESDTLVMWDALFERHNQEAHLVAYVNTAEWAARLVHAPADVKALLAENERLRAALEMAESDYDLLEAQMTQYGASIFEVTNIRRTLATIRAALARPEGGAE